MIACDASAGEVPVYVGEDLLVVRAAADAVALLDVGRGGEQRGEAAVGAISSAGSGAP